LEVHPFNSIIDVNDLPRFEKFPKKIDTISRSKRFFFAKQDLIKVVRSKGQNLSSQEKEQLKEMGEFSVEKDEEKLVFL